MEKLIGIVKERIPKQNQPHLSIMHAGIPAQAEEFARDLANRLSISEIPIYEVPPAIITHGGPGILGVAFFTKSYD
jgi:fatty acid-binding protein DegV